LTEIHDALDPETFAAAWDAGHTTSPERVVEEALANP
jgi:hypothetical protein